MDGTFERYCLARVKNLISISPYVEDELVGRRGFQGRVYRIENPVDDRFFLARDQEQEATILYAGAVIPRKNLLDLLRALVIVRGEMPQVNLRIAGETESAPTFMATCRQFITEQCLAPVVSFLGSLTAEDMANEYARCTLLALTSRQETAPVAIAEAMAAGRPVMATAICGVPYMVEESVSGLLVEPGDVTALANALLRILSDTSLRQKMGARGREMAEARFRAEVVANQTRQVYLGLQEGLGQAAHGE
jgi:glycosyltransferase involved in cell wall biosynthesis